MSQAQTSTLPVSIEFLPGDRPAVRSLELAEHFGLKHKNVLQDIKNLTAKVPESFNGLNFQPVTYRDEKGEERPCYLLTRDAFTLLVMGWSSARAMTGAKSLPARPCSVSGERLPARSSMGSRIGLGDWAKSEAAASPGTGLPAAISMSSSPKP